MWVAAALVCVLALSPRVHAAKFTCPAGDVACLIDAINTANANGEANTITLEAGTYTLTAVDNTTIGIGPSGLPLVTSALTLRGAGAEATSIARDASSPSFRLVTIAAEGILTFEKLTLQGGGGGGGAFPRLMAARFVIEGR
jgi:hypothetical protein